MIRPVILFSFFVFQNFASHQLFAVELYQCPKEGLRCHEGNKTQSDCWLNKNHILSCPGFSPPGGGPAMKLEVKFDNKKSPGEQNAECLCNPFPGNLNAVGLFFKSQISQTRLRLFWINDDTTLGEMLALCHTTHGKLMKLGICSKDPRSEPQMDMSASAGSCEMAMSSAIKQCHRQGFSNYREDHCIPEDYADMSNRDAFSFGKCI